ncbi:hypothetical protein ACQP1V_36225 [Microtetraspora malaysiensis]|uniref:hypothetical protein n=1 Tax=Microtetraspora malaysiensis TaxID=161358 RepID=UPI003D93FCDE
MAVPVSPVAGAMADKALWDAEVYDKWTDVYAGWTPYTPVWSCSATAPNLGNGSLTGAYKAIGKTVEFRIRFVAGSSTAFGDGLWSFSLPQGYAPTAVQSAPGIAINGAASVRWPLACWLSTGTGVFRMCVNGTGGIRTNAGTPANSSPFQWSNSAQVVLGGVYEAS